MRTRKAVQVYDGDGVHPESVERQTHVNRYVIDAMGVTECSASPRLARHGSYGKSFKRIRLVFEAQHEKDNCWRRCRGIEGLKVKLMAHKKNPGGPTHILIFEGEMGAVKDAIDNTLTMWVDVVDD